MKAYQASALDRAAHRTPSSTAAAAVERRSARARVVQRRRVCVAAEADADARVAGGDVLLPRRAALLAAALSAVAAPPARAAGAAASVAPPPPPSLAARVGGALPLSAPLPLRAPEPVGLPRKRLDPTFAVLLMRSCYDAVDAMDVISMEKFQIDFWKRRQSEVEAYTMLYRPLTVAAGNLADPLYFDFISYAQFATISRSLTAPPRVFEERYSCDALSAADEADETACAETLTRVVRRPAALDDDAALPAAFADYAGDRIYDGLVNGFRGVEFGGPRPPAAAAAAAGSGGSGSSGSGSGARFDELVAGARRVLGIFVERGYCLSAELSDVEPPSAGDAAAGSFTVRVAGPATLWGLSALAGQRALVANAHDAMAVAAYLRAAGAAPERSPELTETGWVERWRVLV